MLIQGGGAKWGIYTPNNDGNNKLLMMVHPYVVEIIARFLKYPQ